jgi:hypothetical protein
VIRECSTPGCSTLTFGETCLGCDQRDAGVIRSFPRGRPFVRATDGEADGRATEASGAPVDARAT